MDTVESLIVQNKKLINSEAGKFRLSTRFDIDDAKQECYIATMTASKKYKKEKGSFSACLFFQIKAARNLVRCGISRSIPVPMNIHSRMYDNRKTEGQKGEKELAEHAKTLSVCSLWDEDYDNDSDNESLIDHSDALIGDNEYLYIHKAIDSIPAIEKEVIIRRFGLFGNDEKSLKDVATDIGISYQWAYKVQKKALGKLKIKLKRLGYSHFN